MKAPSAITAGLGRGPRTLRAGLRVVLAFALVLLLVGSAAAFTALLRVQDETDAFVDRLSPARISAVQLSSAYLDQETGIRGFVLARERNFLDPYAQGQQDAAARDAEIRAVFGDDPEIVRILDAIAAAGERWRAEFAEPTIDAVRAADVGERVRRDQRGGKVLFTVVRDRISELNVALAAERARARGALESDLGVLQILSGLALVAVLLAGIAVWVSLRRLVLGPLDRLGEQSRAVADGEFDRQVIAAGPAEIRRLGHDVEEMRERLVASLVVARQAEREVRAQAAQLAEQSAEVQAQAENLRRSNEELEQFAYVASHDLQEPLRKVASFCQMLQRRYGGQLDERADQYIEFAVDGAKRMQQLINDLLAFSRVGRNTDAMTDVDTAAAARRALATLDDVCAEAGAQVELGELPTLPGDEVLLTQLFQNLIGNGIKFAAPERPARVRISAEQEGDDWHFRCEDNGIGIDPQYADRIFVIFQRLHAKDQYTGTGIGLSLCKKIVEHHGGRIWLDTDRVERGIEGAMVHWTLPAVAASAPAHGPEPEPDPELVPEPELMAAGEPEPAGEPERKAVAG